MKAWVLSVLSAHCVGWPICRFLSFTLTLFIVRIVLLDSRKFFSFNRFILGNVRYLKEKNLYKAKSVFEYWGKIQLYILFIFLIQEVVTIYVIIFVFLWIRQIFKILLTRLESRIFKSWEKN